LTIAAPVSVVDRRAVAGASRHSCPDAATSYEENQEYLGHDGKKDRDEQNDSGLHAGNIDLRGARAFFITMQRRGNRSDGRSSRIPAA